jgi:hypothetical protein
MSRPYKQLNNETEVLPSVANYCAVMHVRCFIGLPASTCPPCRENDFQAKQFSALIHRQMVNIVGRRDLAIKHRESNRPSGSMADAGRSSQSPILHSMR